MLKVLACCCALLALTPQPASAEWHFIPTIGLTFGGKTSLIDLEQSTGKVHRNIGGTVTLLGQGIFGVESVFVYTPGFFGSGASRRRAATRWRSWETRCSRRRGAGLNTACVRSCREDSACCERR